MTRSHFTPAVVRTCVFTFTVFFFNALASMLHAQAFPSSGRFALISKGGVEADSAGFRGALIGDIERSLHDIARLNPCEIFRGGRRLDVVGPALGACLLVYAADESLRDATARNVRNTRTVPLVVGETYGSVWCGAGVGCVVYGTGIIAGDSRLRETGRETLTALVCTGVLTSLLKSLSGRSRPALGEGARMFRPFRFDAGHTAFPSGHAAVAFTVTSVLARRIDRPLVSSALYVLALLTAAQRVGSDNHWGSDAFAGAFLGWAIGSLVARDDDSDTADVHFEVGTEPVLQQPGEYSLSLQARVPIPLGRIVSGSR